MHTPRKPSVWTWLAKYGLYLAAAVAIAYVWLGMYPEPDIHGNRSWLGPVLITAGILAGVAIFARATLRDRKTQREDGGVL